MKPLSRVRPAAVLLGACLALAAGCTPPASTPRDAAAPQALATAAEHAAVVGASARAAAVARAARAAQAARAVAAQAAARRVAVQRPAPAATPAAAAQPVLAVTRAAYVPARAALVAETPVQRGARVLASLRYPWRSLGYRFVFLPGRDGYLGLTDAGSRTVTIWVRSSESDLVLAHTIAHELGHALDFSRGTPVRRARYLLVRGLAPQEWYGCSGCTDFQTPAGDWAEVFAQWVAGPGDFRSRLAGVPTRAQLTALDALFSLT